MAYVCVAGAGGACELLRPIVRRKELGLELWYQVHAYQCQPQDVLLPNFWH